MDIPSILGFVGAVLVAAAYIPQINHIVRQHCAYGISVRAWFIWLLAALMILPRAIISGEKLFATLLIIQLIATAFILIFSYFHQDRFCPKHKIL